MICEIEKYSPIGYDDPAWGPVAVALHPHTMEKLASDNIHTPRRILDYIDNLRPRSDGRYLLLNALGAGEYWGVNKNGDFFPEWSLKGEPPPPNVAEYVRSKNLPMPALWGYKTFEMTAYPFRHHNNRDPIHSIGDRVCCAAYNDRMHRVELIIFIYESKAPDLVKKIDAGEPIPWSMGAKLLWDSCSICANAARNRAQYCEHLKTKMNSVYPDGRKVFAYNYFPRFFDISAVYTPADKSAWSLRKVAQAMTGAQDLIIGDHEPCAQPCTNCTCSSMGMEKFAGLFDFLEAGGQKKADILKEVPAQTPSKSLGSEPIPGDIWTKLFDMASQDHGCQQAMPSQTIGELKQFPIAKVLQTLTSLGIVLKRSEVNGLTGGRSESIPERLDFDRPDGTLLEKLKHFVRGRSMMEPHFKIRIVRIMKKEPGGPKRDLSLMKRAGAYEKYKTLLRDGVELEKLAEAMEHPMVQMTLEPGAVENEMFGVREVIPFAHQVAPFIAVIGQS